MFIVYSLFLHSYCFCTLSYHIVVLWYFIFLLFEWEFFSITLRFFFVFFLYFSVDLLNLHVIYSKIWLIILCKRTHITYIRSFVQLLLCRFCFLYEQQSMHICEYIEPSGKEICYKIVIKSLFSCSILALLYSIWFDLIWFNTYYCYNQKK